MLRRQLRLGTSAPVFPWNEVSRYSRVVSVAAIREGNSEPKLAASNQRSTCGNLIWLSATLFSSTLSRQSLLQALLLTRLQVVGVTLHFLNYVFRLNLALEPTQSILQRLTLLQSNFCQTDHPQTRPDGTNLSIHHSE
jgi:hypothetical protein